MATSNLAKILPSLPWMTLRLFRWVQIVECLLEIVTLIKRREMKGKETRVNWDDYRLHLLIVGQGNPEYSTRMMDYFQARINQSWNGNRERRKHLPSQQIRLKRMWTKHNRLLCRTRPLPLSQLCHQLTRQYRIFKFSRIVIIIVVKFKLHMNLSGSFIYIFIYIFFS